MAEDYMPIKRPKIGDSQEEILRMQEDFIRKKLTPCAKVINLGTESQKVAKHSIKKDIQAPNQRISSTSQICGDATNANEGSHLYQSLLVHSFIKFI
jgi:hypothetical protein